MNMGNRTGEAGDKPEQPSLLSLIGICKEVFASLGGAEAFIRAERENFYSSGDRDPLMWDTGTTEAPLE